MYIMPSIDAVIKCLKLLDKQNDVVISPLEALAKIFPEDAS